MIISKKNFNGLIAVLPALIILISGKQGPALYNLNHAENTNICFVSLNSIVLPINSIHGGLPETKKKGFENYAALKTLYLKWVNGLPGSGGYHKRKIYEFLVSIAGQEIKTEYNYKLETASVPSDKRLVCGFYLDNWLQINGKITGESVKNISGPASGTADRSWRSMRFLSVSGRIKNFRLGSDSRGKFIALFLNDIRLEQFDNTEKNNKKQKEAD